MAIWRYLLRPLLPWLARLAVAALASLAVAWVAGTLLIRRAEPDLGYVGEVQEVHVEVLHTLIDEGFVPVVASIAVDEMGQPYNVNADAVAAELAAALEAGKLVYMNDVPGVIGPGGELLSELGRRDVLELLDHPDAVAGGMIQKLRSAVRAIEAGVPRVHLLDGRVEHALVLELFTPEGVGSMVVADASAPAGGER